MSKIKKSDREHLQRVAELGCIVCKNEFGVYSFSEIHHIRAGQGAAQRASHKQTLPLCPPHHRTGGYGVAIHAGQKAWERSFGTECELLDQVNRELGIIV